MAPAVGSTEMRYCGISLLSRVDSVTIALWPAVPTGGVPHLISLGCDCDQAAEAVSPTRATAATVVRTRVSMDSPFQICFRFRGDGPLWLTGGLRHVLPKHRRYQAIAR